MKSQIQKPKMGKSGFTLVETLVAIAILVLAILGPLTIASNSLNASFYARDQVTAYYLAQEGVEAVRYLRDSNTLSGQPWDNGLTGCIGNPCGYNPETNLLASNDCPGNKCYVYFDPIQNLYVQANNQGSFNATNYQRSIILTPIVMNSSTVGYNVVVKASWVTANLSSPRTFQISEDIYNWQQS